MKTTFSSRWAALARRTSLFTILVLFCLGALAVPELVQADNQPASDTTVATPGKVTAVMVLAPPQTATFGWTQNILGNKVRMIQIATVGMALGIALLMWGKRER